MNRSMSTERTLDWFLASDGDQLEERVLEAALAEIARTPQRRRLGVPRVLPNMTVGFRAVALLAVVAGLTMAAAVLLGVAGGQPNPAPSTAPSTAASTAPSAAPSTAPTVAPSRLPTSPPPAVGLGAATPYSSEVYGYQAALPATWTVDHLATRRWGPAANGLDPSSAGVDTFVDPGGTVTVSRWRAQHDPTADPGNPAKMLVWVEALCRRLGDTQCNGIPDRAIPLCGPGGSCPDGLVMVPFRDHVFAFWVGTPDDTVNVAAVWAPEDDPAVARYGGAAALLGWFASHGP
jgi:hypothetical protein